MIASAVVNSHSGHRLLRLYHFYRLCLGLLLVLLISSNLDAQLLDVVHINLFHTGSWIYLIVNIIIAVLVQRPRHLTQLLSLALVDIIFLSALLYAAGGVASGIGNLLVIAVAIANILLRGRIGLLVAAVAAISLVFTTVYLGFSHANSPPQYMQAGALGTLCFVGALLIQGITQRLKLSETLARQRASDVANLEALNTQIIQRMRTGILVLDNDHRVLLANLGATQLLSRGDLTGKVIDPICPELVKRLQQWHHNPALRPASLQATPGGVMLQPSFIALPRGDQQHTLVFLDNISQIAQQAQQLKLASLGRLTAGIAHEIRNPLGAISHAAQLLQESEELDGADKRLAQIIQDHSKRMNLVIENVLQLSRRRQAEPQLLDLKYWLHRFASDFRTGAPEGRTLHIRTVNGTVQTRMDPQQLLQVLTNLVQNGLRYSAQKNGQGQVWLNLYRDPESELPVLEVSDDGPGVPPELVHQIFEPFYTTESNGTGLGLYLSRELCESNQASLDYQPREGGGSCFRITFAHPRKLS